MVLGLHGCADSPLVAERWGRSPMAVCEPLAGAASPVAKHGLQGTLPSAAVAPGLWSTGSAVVVYGFNRSVVYGILPDQGLNSCLLQWQADSLPLSHQGSPTGEK